MSADTICVAQVPGIQGGSTGARSSRHRLCGVWDRHAGWSCQGGSAGFQDYTIQCHEDHLCQEIGMQQVYNWECVSERGRGWRPYQTQSMPEWRVCVLPVRMISHGIFHMNSWVQSASATLCTFFLHFSNGYLWHCTVAELFGIARFRWKWETTW